tara:strand:+ start:283 stop:1377 length:1095 start_codon:yes stop_codon:yes gene_type:complete
MKYQIKKYFKNLDLFLYIILFSFFFNNFVNQISFLHIYKNEWAFSESLIDYSAGFVRRGLLGELFSLISMNLGFAQLKISFIFFTISLAHLLFFVLTKFKNYSFLMRLVLMFSPFGLFYLFSNLNFFFGRRDLLILNFLILFNSKIIKENFMLKILFFIIFGTILTLTYEMFLFFLPIFWNLILIKSKNHSYIKNISFSYLTILNILMLTKFSISNNYVLLCKNIEEKRIQMKLDNLGCWGAPEYLNHEDKSLWINEVLEGLSYRSNYLLWLTLLLLLIIFINNYSFLEFSNKLSVSTLFILFFFAQDYGRWMFLIFFTTLILRVEKKYIESSKFKVVSYMMIFSGLIIDVPIYLFQDKPFFKF